MKLKNLIIFFTTLCALSSCTSMNKITLLNNNESRAETHEVSYDIHKLQVGDLLHVKIIGINEEANRLFNVESAANNLQTTSAELQQVENMLVLDLRMMSWYKSLLKPIQYLKANRWL